MFIDIIIGFAMGVISGFGIGGGTIFIIYLTLFAGINQLTAQGINLVYFIACGTPAVVSHFKNNLIDKKAMIICSVFGVITCIITSILANNLNVDVLRQIFGAFLIYIGIKLVLTKTAST